MTEVPSGTTVVPFSAKKAPCPLNTVPWPAGPPELVEPRPSEIADRSAAAFSTVTAGTGSGGARGGGGGGVSGVNSGTIWAGGRVAAVDILAIDAPAVTLPTTMSPTVSTVWASLRERPACVLQRLARERVVFLAVDQTANVSLQAVNPVKHKDPAADSDETAHSGV